MASPTGDVSTRPMRLKVLYTFDTDSKNNCLARWPQTLQVQTAFVEDLTQIGVVDLQTCLRALATSSPELINQDRQDYTIYAYDYSEEGTPLSGQGMLSTLFQPGPQDQNIQSNLQMVTGRVTRNMLGFFSGSGQETLEVKLKLLPVAKQGRWRNTQSQQPEYGSTDNSEQPVDARGAPSLSRSDSGLNFDYQSVGQGSPADTTGLDNMQRMLHEGSAPRDLSANRLSGSLRGSSSSRAGSRPGTPNGAQSFQPPPARPSCNQASRPSSRASARGNPDFVPHRRRESFNSGYYSGDETPMEDMGPAKKRAKITQVGAPTRSDLNIERQPESLRMAASTASSVRVHRPVAVNPSLSNLQTGSLAEQPVRPPTPIPGARKTGSRSLQSEPSGLRRASLQYHRADMSNPPDLSAVDAVDVSATSPECMRAPSVSSTPANIPSSPPVGPNYASMPSSPILPPPPVDPPDSGFMSGFGDMTADGGELHFDDYLQHTDIHDAVELQPVGKSYLQQSDHHGAVEVQPAAHHGAGTEPHDNCAPVVDEAKAFEEAATDAPISPKTKPPNRPIAPKRPVSRAQKSRPASRPAMSSPKLAPAPYPRARQLEAEMAAQPPLPPVAASDPVGPHQQFVNTLAGELSEVAMSDAPAGELGRARSVVSKKKIGREQTKARLETALAQNEMPPYCDNCGTIDTPAWRRVFAKTLPGHLWETVELWPEIAGAFVWKQAVEQADDGTIKSFRAYKLSKSPEDRGDDWVNVTLCNPCGLWFHKNKCMRPQEKWMRNRKDPNQRKKRADRPKSKRVAAKKGQEDDSKSDAPEPASEGSSPADAATEVELEVNEDPSGKPNVEEERYQERRPQDGRATSAESTLTEQDSMPALGPSARSSQREVRSSPLRNHGPGSHPRQHEVDLTPKPVRRQLFPSPGKKTSPSSQASAGSHQGTTAKPLSDLPNLCRRSPRLNKLMDVFSTNAETPNAKGKENQTPFPSQNRDLDDLFDDGADDFHFGPSTPTPTRRSDRLLLKTPNTKTHSGSHLHSPSSHKTSRSLQALLQKMRTPNKDTAILSNENVEQMTPFSRLMHEETLKDLAVARLPDLSRNHPSNLDFPSLPPSVSDTTPRSRQVASLAEIDYDTLDPDLFRTDGIDLEAAGSPLSGFYNFLNSDYLDPDPFVTSGGAVDWEERGAPTPVVQTEENESTTRLAVPQTTASANPLALRRSPRKNRPGS